MKKEHLVSKIGEELESRNSVIIATTCVVYKNKTCRVGRCQAVIEMHNKAADTYDVAEMPCDFHSPAKVVMAKGQLIEYLRTFTCNELRKKKTVMRMHKWNSWYGGIMIRPDL